MPGLIIHHREWEKMRREVRGLLPVDEQLVMDALDSHDIEDPNKSAAHEDFSYFLERYIGFSGVVPKASMRRTLKYYWVNHLVVDFLDNSNIRFLSNFDAFYKIIRTARKPLAAYANRLLLRAGVNSECIRLIEDKKDLIVRKQLFLIRNKLRGKL